MSDWKLGDEDRRGMNKDWIERDRLLSKIDSNVDQIVLWSKTHETKDDATFKEIKKRIFWLTVACVVMAMIIGGPELVAKLVK